MTAAFVVALVVVSLRHGRPVRRRPVGPADLVDQATLLGLGVAGGMNLRSALEWSGRYLHPDLAATTATVLRTGQLHGLSDGLRSAEGVAVDLFRSLARAVDSGAALGQTIAAHREVLEAERVADLEANLQRLPVKLLFPLALLMLPGLVVMIAAPALLDAVARFR